MSSQSINMSAQPTGSWVPLVPAPQPASIAPIAPTAPLPIPQPTHPANTSISTFRSGSVVVRGERFDHVEINSHHVMAHTRWVKKQLFPYEIPPVIVCMMDGGPIPEPRDFVAGKYVGTWDDRKGFHQRMWTAKTGGAALAAKARGNEEWKRFERLERERERRWVEELRRVGMMRQGEGEGQTGRVEPQMQGRPQGVVRPQGSNLPMAPAQPQRPVQRQGPVRPQALGNSQGGFRPRGPIPPPVLRQPHTRLPPQGSMPPQRPGQPLRCPHHQGPTHRPVPVRHHRPARSQLPVGFVRPALPQQPVVPPQPAFPPQLGFPPQPAFLPQPVHQEPPAPTQGVQTPSSMPTWPVREEVNAAQEPATQMPADTASPPEAEEDDGLNALFEDSDEEQAPPMPAAEEPADVVSLPGADEDSIDVDEIYALFEDMEVAQAAPMSSAEESAPTPQAQQPAQTPLSEQADSTPPVPEAAQCPGLQSLLTPADTPGTPQPSQTMSLSSGEKSPEPSRKRKTPESEGPEERPSKRVSTDPSPEGLQPVGDEIFDGDELPPLDGLFGFDLGGGTSRSGPADDFCDADFAECIASMPDP